MRAPSIGAASPLSAVTPFRPLNGTLSGHLPCRTAVLLGGTLLVGLLFALGTPAQAQTCTPPAFWNEFSSGGGRCEVHLCAEGFTQDNNRCMLNGTLVGYAASCPVGWGVTAVEGPWLYTMRCVDPSPAGRPPGRARRILETRVGLVFATEADSLGQSYSFTLASRQTVSVSLTGMNRNFDCSVNSSFCSNRDGTRDDSWTGELAAGSHSIRVSPSSGRRGDYTIMAVVHCPPGHFASGGSCYRYVPPDRPAVVRPDRGASAPLEDDRAPGTAPEVETPP